MTDTPERIFVAYAGDHVRYWGRKPSPSLDCTEYLRADARPVPAGAVKSLAWEDGYAFCPVSGGFWHVTYHAGRKSWGLAAQGMPNASSFDHFPSEDAAKAAAQEDFERRIMAAISPVPADDVEGLARAYLVAIDACSINASSGGADTWEKIARVDETRAALEAALAQKETGR